MSVGTYALTTSADAAAYLGGYPQVNSFWALYSGANATATIQINDNSVVLVDSTTTTIDTTAAAYDTITELIAKINTVSGWTSGLIGVGAALGVDLVTTGALSAKSTEQTIQIYDVYGVEKLVDRATDFIERYCGRKFKTRSYDRVQYTGNGGELLILNQYPVTRVFRVSEGMTNTFYVTNTTATNFATVEVNATQLRLNADGALTNLTLSTYATINLLIAAVNATSGWTATLVAEGTRCPYYTGSDGSTKVAELIPMPAQRCMSPNVAYVQVPGDDVDDYWIMAGGLDEDRDAGMLMREGGWVNGEIYLVDAICGWTTIPAALEEACLMLVKYARDKMSKDGVLQGEGLGDYNYQMGVMCNTFNKDMLDQIKLFRAFEF
jgi:hypothetical protein